MKKTFFPALLFIIFISPGKKMYSQILKLNNAFNFSSGIVVDSKGNVFVTGQNNRIIKITPEGKAELFAGGGRNNKDGKGKAAGFNNTSGIAIDRADNMYLTDGTLIRKITPDATVTTIAGINNAEVKDGNRLTASFLNLDYITIDNNGNIYVTDYEPGKDWRPGQSANSSYYRIRKITSDGIVTTLQNENAGPLVLQYPRRMACDKAGNLYVCASSSHCIKKITPAGIITTAAGQCDKTIYRSVYKEGNISTAVLTTPSGIAIADNGDIYISDERLNRIIKIADNKVTTVAGCGKISFTGNIAGAAESGEKDGKAKQALFDSPTAIAFDRSGNLYIVDGSSKQNSYIRKLSADGMVSTFCKHSWNPKTEQYEATD